MTTNDNERSWSIQQANNGYLIHDFQQGLYVEKDLHDAIRRLISLITLQDVAEVFAEANVFDHKNNELKKQRVRL